VKVKAMFAVVVVACVVGAASAASALATPPANGQVTAALFGRIQEGPYYDSAGSPSWVPLTVDVNLFDPAGNLVGTARPNEWGEFRFAHVDRGTWTVAITYPSLFDPVYAYRTYTRTLTWTSTRDSYEVLVDIDPYMNIPSYDAVNKYTRCPDPVPAGKGCKK
jgi:hypothetical protein